MISTSLYNVAQDRDVYDLTRINAAQSQAYQRLDFRFEQARQFGANPLTWRAALQCVERKNLYMEVWEPRTGVPSAQDQMPRFATAGYGTPSDGLAAKR